MSNTASGYYGFPFNPNDILNDTLIQNGMVDELFYLKDLQQRKLFLNTEIDQSSVFDIVRHILQINREDAGIEVADRKPILLYIVSTGGEFDAGFELIDVITNSKTPVYTISLANQYSMGLYIALAGHKRFAMPNSKFLLHDGDKYIYNSGAKVQDVFSFQKCVEERLRDYVILHSKITREEYDSKLRVEWYMFADEAKTKGFIDYIVGVDCDIDAIV